jgi:isoquinoline 1-oxidoreductase subunit alpha
MIELVVNQTRRRIDGDPATPLLWYLRDELGLMGTRFGCGAGLCGCCTVHVGKDAVRSWCGYCQSGQIMQAAALLQAKPDPSASDIDSAMAGNLCRGGTYPRIRAAIKQVASGKKAAPAATKRDRS